LLVSTLAKDFYQTTLTIRMVLPFSSIAGNPYHKSLHPQSRQGSYSHRHHPKLPLLSLDEILTPLHFFPTFKTMTLALMISILTLTAGMNGKLPSLESIDIFSFDSCEHMPQW
jgi:hypothetical protein